MADYIEREALLQAVLDLPAKMDEQGYGWLGRRGVWQMALDFPAADVRPVVLCRDCYAYRRDKELAEAAHLDPKMYCGLLCCEMGEDSFCSYGKRKGEKS